ncbi:MAG: hypothetical protein ACJ70Z_08530 [Nitrososphaera sp.]
MMMLQNYQTVDLATYEGKYPKSLFNKGVRTQDKEHVGRVMTEAGGKSVVGDTTTGALMYQSQRLLPLVEMSFWEWITMRYSNTK